MISDQQFSELLLAEGLISRPQLQEAKSFQRVNGGELYTVVIENSFVQEEPTVVSVAGMMGIPCVSLREFQGSPDALDMVSADLAKRHRVIPLGITPDQRGVYLAMANPIDMLALDEISVTTGCDIIAFLAGPVDIAQALERCYGRILYDDRSIISSVFTMDQLAGLGDLNTPLTEGFELFDSNELPPIEDLNLAFDLDDASLLSVPQKPQEPAEAPILLTNEDLFSTPQQNDDELDVMELELELELELESIDLPDLDEDPQPFAPIELGQPISPPHVQTALSPPVPANISPPQPIAPPPQAEIPPPPQYDTLEELLRAVDPRFLQRSIEPVQVDAHKKAAPPQPKPTPAPAPSNQLPPPLPSPKPVPPKPAPPKPIPPPPLGLAPRIPSPPSANAPKPQLPPNLPPPAAPTFRDSPQLQPRQPKPRVPSAQLAPAIPPTTELPGITGFLSDPEDNSIFGGYSDFMSSPDLTSELASSEATASLLYLESRRKASSPPKSQRRRAMRSQVAPFPEELSQVAIKPLFQPQVKETLPPAVREASTRTLLLTVLDVLVRNQNVSIAEILNTMGQYEKP